MIQSHPSSRIVIVLLMLTILILAVVMVPGEADGRVSARTVSLSAGCTATDALATSDKCLTQNRKGLNWWWLSAVCPAGSDSPIYSLCVSLKSDISRP